MSKENKCVCCNSVIPEGTQICRKCERDSKKKSEKKANPLEKIEELKLEIKQWVYKHFIGVYIGIGVTICLIFFVLGIIIGQALPGRTEQPVVYTSSVSDTAITSQTSSSDIELIFRSTQ